jgi:hypothetical protein
MKEGVVELAYPEAWYVWMNEWTNERMNEWMNKWMNNNMQLQVHGILYLNGFVRVRKVSLEEPD